MLSNPEKRRRYDELIDEHQKAQRPQVPTNSTPSRQPQPSHAQRSQTIHKFRITPWRQIPKIVKTAIFLTGFGIFAILVNQANPTAKNETPTAASSTMTTESSTIRPTQPKSGFSDFPCENGQTTSPIDGGECKNTVAAKPNIALDVALDQPKKAAGGTARLEDIDEQATAGALGSTPTSTNHLSGVYFGTVHNKTANLLSTFEVVLQERLERSIEGCMEVKPPLSGSGSLVGFTSGSHIEFVVNNIKFLGNVRGKDITGSYLVSKGNGAQEVGEFNLERAAGSAYQCVNGLFAKINEPEKPAYSIPKKARSAEVKTANSTDVIVVRPEAPRSPRIFGNATVARWAQLKKLCAFDTGSIPCGYDGGKWGTIANLRQGDRVQLLSPRDRAKNGADIYKVSTAQGWEGWVDGDYLRLDR